MKRVQALRSNHCPCLAHCSVPCLKKAGSRGSSAPLTSCMCTVVLHVLSSWYCAQTIPRLLHKTGSMLASKMEMGRYILLIFTWNMSWRVSDNDQGYVSTYYIFSWFRHWCLKWGASLGGQQSYKPLRQVLFQHALSICQAVAEPETIMTSNSKLQVEN